MSLVNISIVGNVVKQPQTHNFASGKTKTTLVVAVDTPTKKDDGRYASDFYRVEAWGKLGEIAHKYLAKGSLVGATGRLVLSHWQDRDGRDRVTPTVEADQIALPPKPQAGFSTSGVGRTNPVDGVMHFDSPDDGATVAPSEEPAAAVSAAPATQSMSMQPDPTGGIKDSDPPIPDTGPDGDGEDTTSPADPDEEWNEAEAVFGGKSL
ncbi:MAG TPA: single-stranded DNA-binding protein [Candidatus Obscuribacterales bacterium]